MPLLHTLPPPGTDTLLTENKIYLLSLSGAPSSEGKASKTRAIAELSHSCFSLDLSQLRHGLGELKGPISQATTSESEKLLEVLFGKLYSKNQLDVRVGQGAWLKVSLKVARKICRGPRARSLHVQRDGG